MVKKRVQRNLKNRKYNFALLYGSTRRNRLGIRFVKYIEKQINLKGHKPFIIDPLKQKLPLLDKRFVDYKKLKAPENIRKVHKILKNANAFILVSAEYNHMPPAALINIFNFLIVLSNHSYY